MTAKWVSNLVEKSKRPNWTKEFQRPEDKTCRDEAERQASRACRWLDR
jgi:hypothetical protein